MSLTCIACDSNAGANCSRCNAAYCGRECQIKHWPTHKKECNQVKFLKTRNIKFVELAHKRIGGNISIYHAHYRSKAIFVEINETIEEFSRGESGHFAHIYGNDLPVEYAKEQFGQEISQLEQFTTPIIYILNDFHHVIGVSEMPDLVNRVKPAKMWSVWFEL